MLALSRGLDESIIITMADGRRMEVMIGKISRDQVELLFRAPQDIRINRKEVQDEIDSNVGHDLHGDSPPDSRPI